MKNTGKFLQVVLLLFLANSGIAEERQITESELQDKLHGFWVGQLVGNYMGFPFENVYVDEAIPVLVEQYYTVENANGLRINHNDHRAYTGIMSTAFDGAYSDDDTDIEFVILHAVEKFGLDINYPEIRTMWMNHINRRIWVANRTARNLMDEGLVPPATGMKENNPNWFQIDPQLVNEIWSAFYPGMINPAAEKAEWSARITNDDWGLHPTIAYAVMYSAAFFEDNPEKLVQYALDALPEESPFTDGIKDVIKWHQQYEDWRECRQRIHDKYYRYKKGDYEAPVSVVSSLQNGLCGIMAILYGEGDFLKTTGIAVSAGYDCDNQAATCAGLIGVMNGIDGIPDKLKYEMNPQHVWDEPFNNTYINYTRDGLPIYNRISDIVQRIKTIAEDAILDHGGSISSVNGERVYTINSDF